MAETLQSKQATDQQDESKVVEDICNPSEALISLFDTSWAGYI